MRALCQRGGPSGFPGRVKAPKPLTVCTKPHTKLALRAISGQSLEKGSNSNGTAEPFHVEPLAAEEPASKKQQFNWYKAWYPMAVLEDLDPAVPTSLKLLGMDLVVWYDRNSREWRAFQDRCPHRLAPLSEGRIDESTGHLFCNYHGWQFNGQGSCTSVPQLPPGQNLSRSRSCAVSYPTRQAEGLLWVWPDASPAAAVESADAEAWPGLAPEITLLGDKAFSTGLFNNHKWYARDLPASYLAAKENAYNDCSHDTVLHHGVASINRAAARPISAKLVEMTPTGYTVRETNGFFQDTTRFPCGARRDYPKTGGGAGVAYIVPTGIGTCRQFHTFLDKTATQTVQQTHSSDSNSSSSSVAPDSGGKGDSKGSAGSGSSSSSVAKVAAPSPGLNVLLTRWLWGHAPTWLQHMQSHLLIDADLAMQSRVDVNRAINDHVYMPAAADAGPAAYMRWLKEYGGGGPPVAKLHSPFMGQTPALPTDRQQLLDRFNSHTVHCKACRTAYSQLSATKVAAAVVAVMCGSAAMAAGLLLAVGWPAAAAAGAGGAAKGASVVVALAGAGAAAAWLYAVLSRLVQGFVFVDYDRHHCSKK